MWNNQHKEAKMLFIMNALERGWSVKKRGDLYIFTKKHKNQRKYFYQSYLENFLVKNVSTNDFTIYREGVSILD